MTIKEQKRRELTIAAGVTLLLIVLFVLHLISIYDKTVSILSLQKNTQEKTSITVENGTKNVLLTNSEHRELMTLNPFEIAAVSKSALTDKQPVKTAPKPIQQNAGAHNLKLVGTISGSKGWAAILDTQKNIEGFYSPGSTIKDGVKLLSVTRTTATILYNQNREVLHLNDSLKGGTASTADSPSPASSIVQSAMTQDGFGNRKDIQVSKEELKDSFKNLSHLLSQMRVQAYFEKGKPSGFLISKIREGSFVEKIGGKKGDIIRSVNGEKVDSVQKAFKLYNSFKNNQSLKMEITRDGKPVNLNFSIK